MRIVLFGATGMVGQGVLRECLLDPGVERVLAVGRHPTGQRHDKLRELRHADFTDFSGVEGELRGHDACFWLSTAAAPLFPVLKAVAPGAVTTTEEVGRAMLAVARRGAPARVLESRDIVAVGRLA